MRHSEHTPTIILNATKGTHAMLTLEAFEEASKKVKEVTQETKLIYSPYFSSECGNEVC